MSQLDGEILGRLFTGCIMASSKADAIHLGEETEIVPPLCLLYTINTPYQTSKLYYPQYPTMSSSLPHPKTTSHPTRIQNHHVLRCDVLQMPHRLHLHASPHVRCQKRVNATCGGAARNPQHRGTAVELREGRTCHLGNLSSTPCVFPWEVAWSSIPATFVFCSCRSGCMSLPRRG